VFDRLTVHDNLHISQAMRFNNIVVFLLAQYSRKVRPVLALHFLLLIFVGTSF